MLLTSTYKATVAPYFSGEKETFATVLLGCLFQMYGVEVLEWDPATIELQIKDDLEVEIPRLVYDQVMALITALTTTAVYIEAEAFDNFVGGVCRAGVLDDNGAPAVDEVAWAVTELQLNDPHPEGRPGQPFSKNIGRYVRAVLDDEGLYIPPKSLSFAAERSLRRDHVDDAASYAGAYQAAQAAADEVDDIVRGRLVTLFTHLMEVGIDLSGFTARAEPRR